MLASFPLVVVLCPLQPSSESEVSHSIRLNLSCAWILSTGTVVLFCQCRLCALQPSSESEVSLQQPRLHTVVLDSGVFERWRQFGTSNGLTSDTNIATYLLQQSVTISSTISMLLLPFFLSLVCMLCWLVGFCSSVSNQKTLITTHGAIQLN